MPYYIRTSIIIVNFNSWDKLKICLKSIYPTIQPNDEVIVVDNCSSANDIEKIRTNFPWVNIIKSTTNLGYGGGNNLGVKYAKGEYLVFLNPDTTVEMGWLDPLISTLNSSSEIGLVTSKILLMDNPNYINTFGNDIHISGLTLCRGMGKDQSEYKSVEEVCAISGAAFMIRKNVFIDLGGFDEEFFMYMEDADLSLRAQLAGWKCVTVPESIVYHDYKLTFGPYKIFYQERNRYLLLLKNFHLITLLLISPSLLVAEVVTWGFVILQDRQRCLNKINAYRWVIKNWQMIRIKKKACQKLRKVSDRHLFIKESYKLDLEQTGKNIIITTSKIIFDLIFLIFKFFTLIFLWW